MPTERPRRRRRFLASVAAAAGGALAGCAGAFSGGPGNDPGTDDQRQDTDDADRESDAPLGGNGRGVDDWQYTPPSRGDGGATNASGGVQMAAGGSSGGDGGSVGLAAGGAKDVAAFRRNVSEGYLPIPQSLSYEGLFYDYYFETGGSGSCASDFCPTYSPAVTRDPLSDETERYLTVGLNSGIAADAVERDRLNLVVVLDISGSMSGSFSSYYYDRYGNRRTPEGETDRPKIDVARDALVALTEQLRPDDRLGIVLYSGESAVAKPMRTVADTDMDAIRTHIREDVEAVGSTNLSAGVADATDLLADYRDADPATTENRILVLTDAMPNVGETSAGGLRTTLEDNADRGIHATFVGVGLDFNAELVDAITAIRGANYYSVHSADEFERRLGAEFTYMVTPLVFDLALELDAEGYDIEKVYGSTAAEESTGRLVHVNTLFPSPTEAGRTRGGVVLVKVARQSADGGETVDGGDSAEATMELAASWETRAGVRRKTATTVEFPATGPEQFANSGVRKAVLLSRYADLLKNWTVAERRGEAPAPDDGIDVPPTEDELGQWEQQSDPLTVSDAYETRLSTFREHFESEMEALGDDALQQEVETIGTILSTDGS